MRINGFRCDGCGKEHLLDPSLMVQEFYRDTLPATWFLVSMGGRDQRDPWTFCSHACLGRLASGLVSSAKEVN